MKRIYNALNKNLKTYFPGQHKGLCEDPYIVLRESTQIPQIGTNQVGQRLIDVIIYAPKNSYVKAEDYRDEVKHEIKKIEVLRKTGNETPWVLDNDKEALTTSVLYTIMKRL